RDGVVLEERQARRGEGEERVLSEDRVVALEDVQVEGVRLPTLDVGIIIHGGMALAVAVPRRKADAPAVLDRDEVGVRLLLARQDAGRSGVAQWGVHLRPVEAGQGSGRRSRRRLGRVELDRAADSLLLSIPAARKQPGC